MKYQYIVNPVTNRKCSVDSTLGKKIINNYIQLGGGMKMKDFPNTYKFIRIVLGNNPNVHKKVSFLLSSQEIHNMRLINAITFGFIFIFFPLV